MHACGRWLKILSQLGKSADEKADVPYSTGESVVSTPNGRIPHHATSVTIFRPTDSDWQCPAPL